MIKVPCKDKIKVAKRKAYYLLQKSTKWNIDKGLLNDLPQRNYSYWKSIDDNSHPAVVEKIWIDELDLSDISRFSVFRDDIYKRFVVSNDGSERDDFGRNGKWIPRGCKIYFDSETQNFIKVFDEYFCRQGEGKFLEKALNLGLYNYLCPNLSYVILDRNKTIRGYAIQKGRPLTQYEFELYIGQGLKEIICKLTERTGLYFYDLTPSNVIIKQQQLSFIDLESILPLNWFQKNDEFSLNHLSDIDIGFSIQKKWHSPIWYRKFLERCIK